MVADLADSRAESAILCGRCDGLADDSILDDPDAVDLATHKITGPYPHASPSKRVAFEGGSARLWCVAHILPCDGGIQLSVVVRGHTEAKAWTSVFVAIVDDRDARKQSMSIKPSRQPGTCATTCQPATASRPVKNPVPAAIRQRQ
jgi:hypothetical protein